MDKQEVNIQYGIRKVQTKKLSYEDIEKRELTARLDDGENVEIDVHISTQFKIEEDVLAVEITTQLKDKKDGLVWVEHTGLTEFFIVDLKKFAIEPDAINLPDQLIKTMYALAYTHCRGLLASELKGTEYQDVYILPLVNPDLLLNLNREKSGTKPPKD